MNLNRFVQKYFCWVIPWKVVKIDVNDSPYIHIEIPNWNIMEIHPWKWVIKSINTYVLLSDSAFTNSLIEPINKETYEYFRK